MPNKHSSFAKARRLAKKTIIDTSFHDVKKAETVCMMEREQIAQVMNIPVVAVPDVEKGLILSDSRGEGSLQR